MCSPAAESESNSFKQTVLNVVTVTLFTTQYEELGGVVVNTELWKTRGLHSKQTYVVNISNVFKCRAKIVSFRRATPIKVKCQSPSCASHRRAGITPRQKMYFSKNFVLFCDYSGVVIKIYLCSGRSVGGFITGGVGEEKLDYGSEINPTRCNNCVYSSQWLYSTCFG